MGGMQVRSNLQRALGRPVGLDEASNMTIGALKALEGQGEEDGGSPSADESSSNQQQGGKAAAPVIEPSQIVDLDKDLPQLIDRPAPVRAKAAKEDLGKAGVVVKRSCSVSSLNVPQTPDRHSRQVP